MKRYSIILLVLGIILLLVAILSSCVGALKISPQELFSIIAYQLNWSDKVNFTPQQEAVFFNLRLPRVILGVLVGSSLSVSGAAMQGLFRNPLAEPGLIGISSGASLFAVLVIVLEARYFSFLSRALGYHALTTAAFIGACLTTFLVYRLAQFGRRNTIATLLLLGIAMNALTGSFTGLLTYMATDAQLRTITFWNFGSLGGANWQVVIAILPFVMVPLLVLPFLSKALNALALGEAQAAHIGVNVQRLKKIIIVLATLGVGACVAVSGVIGFVGLVVPHILRGAFTADHRLVIPGSALFGASVLVLADLIARTIVAPSELPIGILTALIGTPVFIYIIFRDQRKKNDF